VIGFNFGVSIGIGFRPWGWGYNRFDWGAHAIFVNNARWGRSWANRAVYVHPYAANLRRVGPAARPGFAPAARPVESHSLQPRSEQERRAWQNGHAREEEHRR
jgi:hypothetical protein